MGAATDTHADPELTGDPDELLVPFFSAMKPASQHRLGAETERFGVVGAEHSPLPYEGEVSVSRVLAELGRYGWEPSTERPGAPIIAMTRGQASVTLEPGAQLELSGSPFETVHEVAAELDEHLAELAPISEELGITWLATGFHPLARQSELPWVPKDRYAHMRAYFPTVGTRGLDMMRRTATCQVNLDYATEDDAVRKVRVALRLAPLMAALFASSPFREGRPSGLVSGRADVWLDVDPHRSGLPPAMLDDGARLADYVQWGLDAPMFLFKRDGVVVANTGQPFRSFLAHGYQGHRARAADWELHLNTLFPEARLKRTLEIRGADSVPPSLWSAIPALWAGLVYDPVAQEEAEAFTDGWSHDELLAVRRQVPVLGLRAPFRGATLVAVAERVLDIAAGGLERRARLGQAPGAAGGAAPRDERVYLEALVELVQQGRSLADVLLLDLDADRDDLADEIVRRTRI